MNISFILHGIEFEWDPEKASANLAKHDVPFKSACEIFFDPMIMATHDEVIDDELREHVIGMTVNWRMLYVIYVLKDDSVRIISARLAEPHERRRYENQ